MSRIPSMVTLSSDVREIEQISQNLGKLASALQTIVGGQQISRNAGMYSVNSPSNAVSAGTTSATYADMPTTELLLRDVRAGELLEFEGFAYLYNATVGAVLYCKMVVNDGANKPPDNPQEITATSNGAAALAVTFVHRYTAVTSGDHTLKFQVHTSAGTAQFRDCATIRARAWTDW